MSKICLCKMVGITGRKIFFTFREDFVNVRNCSNSGSSRCDPATSESEICVGSRIGST